MSASHASSPSPGDSNAIASNEVGRVLVVDDHRKVREAMADVLRQPTVVIVAGEVVPYKTYNLGEAPKMAADEKTINHRVDQAIKSQKSRPAANSPWRNFKFGSAAPQHADSGR